MTNNEDTWMSLALKHEAEIERLRGALVEANEDRLYNAIGCGATGNEGKWWPGGMSDAEWFCTMAEIGRRPQFTKEELLKRVPTIAQKMVEAVSGALRG